MTQKQKNELARLLYSNNICSAESIAQKLAITEEQVYEWAHKERWGSKPMPVLSTRDEQLYAFYDQLANLNEKIKEGAGYPSDKEAMTQRRLATAIAKLETECHVGMIIKVAKEFTTWLDTIDKEQCTPILQFLDQYIKIRLKRTIPYINDTNSKC
jgi:hypothetical protein